MLDIEQYRTDIVAAKTLQEVVDVAKRWQLDVAQHQIDFQDAKDNYTEAKQIVKDMSAISGDQLEGVRTLLKNRIAKKAIQEL